VGCRGFFLLLLAESNLKFPKFVHMEVFCLLFEKKAINKLYVDQYIIGLIAGNLRVNFISSRHVGKDF